MKSDVESLSERPRPPANLNEAEQRFYEAAWKRHLLDWEYTFKYTYVAELYPALTIKAMQRCRRVFCKEFRGALELFRAGKELEAHSAMRNLAHDPTTDVVNAAYGIT